MKRLHRMFRQELDAEELANLLRAEKVIGPVVKCFNEKRLNSALGSLAPNDYYRGSPEERLAERRRKLVEERHRTPFKKLGVVAANVTVSSGGA